MRKVVVGFLVLIVVFAASCSKNPTSGGTWTFLGNTYNATTCVNIGNTLAASSSNNTNINIYGGVTVVFPGNKLPGTSGTYTVVDTTPVGSQVNVIANVGGTGDTAYIATGGNGSNQTVQFNISGGKVTISGSNIEMYYSNLGDSAPLTFKIYN